MKILFKVACMKSMLRQLLFEPVRLPESRGRSVRIDADEPDILLTTGPLEERILGLMAIRSYPMTCKEIAVGIGSNASQVNRGLRTLMNRGDVDVVEIPGSVREYVLKQA